MLVGCEGGAITTALTFYIRDIGAVSGITEFQSASLLSIMAITGFPTSFCSGFLLEKMPCHVLLAAAFIVEGICCVQMIYMRDMFTGIFFAISWGFSTGIRTIALQYIWPDYYGTNCLGKINSLNGTSLVIGSAIGPLAYGLAIDYVGSWSTILWWTAPISITSAVLLLFCAKKPVHESD